MSSVGVSTGVSSLNSTSASIDQQTEDLQVSVSASVASINSANSSSTESSTGEAAGSLIEHEDIIALTNYVKNFREILAQLRRIFTVDSPTQAGACKDAMRVKAHEQLGEVLRVLRIILEKYPPIQSTQLLMAAGKLIQQVKRHNYEEETAETTQFFEAIDQLAFAFSNRVSEYLMGNAEKPGNDKNFESYDGLVGSNDDFSSLSLSDCDEKIQSFTDGIEIALHRAKVWSKYAKDLITYIERRAQLEAENARNRIKLAQTMKNILKEESYLPLQSVYLSAVDQDIENCNNILANCSLILGYKFIEPLEARRNEHEKVRKEIKQEWQREVKKTQETINNLRKARSLYHQRQQEHERAKNSARNAESGPECMLDQNKIDRKRKLEDEALIKVQEAESLYRNALFEANDRIRKRKVVKKELLIKIRELIYRCDQTLKAVTAGYFHSQQKVVSPLPSQYQTLCENSRLYEPGSQYLRFIKKVQRLPQEDHQLTFFEFEPCEMDRRARTQRGRSASGSDGGESAEEPAINAKNPLTISSEDELDLEIERENNHGAPNNAALYKSGQSHNLRKLKTPSKCIVCRTLVYFQGITCEQCGTLCHRKCFSEHKPCCCQKDEHPSAAFGSDFRAIGDEVPLIVVKCITELEKRGKTVQGLYRVSGVKSRVEELCQSFENGADQVDISDTSPNVIANVLKLYLRQLPEPLMTFKAYPDFISIGKQYPSNFKIDSVVADNVVSQLKEAVVKLPQVHYHTLSYLCHHLKRVAELHQQNNMPASNLGIVFGPTLLWTSEGSASMSTLVDTVHRTRVVELLIAFADRVFGPQLFKDNNCPSSLNEDEGEELPYDCEEEDIESPECIVTVIKKSTVKSRDSSSGSGDGKISRREKVIDSSQPSSLDSEKGNDQSSLFPSSSVVKLSGQQIITTNPSRSVNQCNTALSGNSARASVNELRRQFFTSSTPPPLHHSMQTASSVSSCSSLSLPQRSPVPSSSPTNSNHSYSPQGDWSRNINLTASSSNVSNLSKNLSLSSQSINKSARSRYGDTEVHGYL